MSTAVTQEDTSEGDLFIPQMEIMAAAFGLIFI